MNLNTIPGIVKAIHELRRDVDELKSQPQAIESVQPAIENTIRRGRPRKQEDQFDSKED